MCSNLAEDKILIIDQDIFLFGRIDSIITHCPEYKTLH